MNSMNVLYIVGGEGRRHGSEIIAIDLLSAGRENGINYTVVTANRGAVQDACIELGIPCYVFPFTFYVYKEMRNNLLDLVKKTIWTARADYLTARAVKSIEKHVDMNSIDVIHTNLSRDLLGGILSRKYGIPHLWHIQELFKAHYQLSFLKKNQLEWMSKHADAFIAISNTVAQQWIENGLPSQKVNVICNGVDFSEIIPKSQYPNTGKLRLVMVGHIVPAKGQETIIRNLCKLPEDIKKNISLDCYGEGQKAYLDKLRQIAENNEVSLNLRGYSSAIGDVLKEYDIGVNCSRGEGFGLSTVEFMAAGLCPVAANTGANTELIEDGINGCIFDINGEEEFLSVIIRLFHNREEVRTIGQMARNYALDKYTINKMQDKVYLAYRSVAKK